MALQLTFSCDADKTDDGPTLIHSTGVESYKIPPDVIQFLQQALSNDRLSDHEDGVLCQESPQQILQILRQHGFTLENESNDDHKASWTVVQQGHHEGGGNESAPADPSQPAHDEGDGGAAAGSGDDQGGDGDGEENAHEGAGGDAEEEKDKEEE